MSSFYDRRVEALPDRADLATAPCPVCGGVQAQPRFAVDGIASPIVVCCGCGVGSFLPLPSDEAIRNFYPPAYYGHDGRKFNRLVELPLRIVGARHIRFLIGDLEPGARILDVGCGRGVLLSELADRGFEVHGVELSEEATRGADPRAAIRIAPTLAEAGYAADSFDRVIVWHVLEHLRDPAGMIAEARRILRSGGELIISVPNFGSAQARWSGAAWFHLDPPRHLWHFPHPALVALVRRHGFGIVSEHHFSLRQNPFGWLQSALNRRRDLPRNGLYVLLHARDPSQPPPYTAAERRRLRLAWILGTPIALALSALDTVRRDGATTTVVGRRP